MHLSILIKKINMPNSGLLELKVCWIYSPLHKCAKCYEWGKALLVHIENKLNISIEKVLTKIYLAILKRERERERDALFYII